MIFSVCVTRYLVNPDQTLQIHYATAQDAGKYTCTAVNDAGMVTASAQLLVEGKIMSTYDFGTNRTVGNKRAVLFNKCCEKQQLLLILITTTTIIIIVTISGGK